MDFNFPEYEYGTKDIVDRFSTMITFVDVSLFENVYLKSNEYNAPFIRSNFSLRLYNPFLHGTCVSEEKENFVHI